MKKLSVVTTTLTFLMFITPALAATFSQLIELNGTLYLNMTYEDGISKLFQVIEADGIAYINMTFEDGTSKLVELEQILNQTQEYIKEHEGAWSTDIVGGISVHDLVYYIKGAINWLLGRQETPDIFMDIGTALDSYFASDRDVRILVNKIRELEIRIKTLEESMEDVAAEAYCRGKITVMKEYNLTWVKCGKTITYYWNVNPDEWQGKDVIGITPITVKLEAAPIEFANITIVKFDVQELEAGKNSSAFITVKNLGNATGSAEVFLEIPEGWTLFPEKVNITLEPGQEEVVEFIVFVPEEAKEKNIITGLVTYLLLNETKEVSEEKEVTIKPRVVPISTLITGYAVLIAKTPEYLLIISLAVIAVILAIFRVKWVKPVRKKGMALFSSSLEKRKKARKRKK